METKKCPECGNETEKAVTTCPNCGYHFEENIEMAEQETETPVPQKATAGTDIKQSSDPFKTIRRCLIAGMIVFALFSGIFFGRAHNVRTVYQNSDYYAKNAYVGGDAYNFIINGTYFTGYCVTASGCMVCAAVFGVGAAAIKPKPKESEEE